MIATPIAIGFAVVAALLVLALTARSRFALSPRRRWTAAIVRAFVVALVVSTALDLRVDWPTDDLAVAAVLDESAAIAASERQALAASLAATSQANDGTLRVVGASRATANGGARADVAQALGTAVATLPTDRVRRVLLATDGRDPEGDLPAAIEAARRAGVQVDVLPVGASPHVDRAAIVAVAAPRLARAGETLDVAATVHASGAASATIEAFLDGASVATAPAPLEAGETSGRVAITFPEEPGVHVLELAVRTPGDPLPGNDRWRTLVEVLPKPRARIYHAAGRGEPVLARTLREAGMEVEVATPQQAFASVLEYDRHALVIADEIELGDLSDAQQHAIRGWVEEHGGGLLTVTGANPVRRTPRVLREIEPIEPPPALPDPHPLELVIVIDRSSSMSGAAMDSARRAGVAAVRALHRDARVGAVAFSGAADRVHPTVAMDQAESVVGFVQGLRAEGGTNIAAAVQAANRVMSTDPRYIHHVVLISDGESEPQSALAAAIALAGRGVSISTITIGQYSDLLAEIARIGRGRYHVTSPGAGLTSLVVSEAMYRQPPAHRQTPFAPREATHLAMLDGVSLEGGPMLAGHALASARQGATVAYTATEGMPLLAHWHRGLGQVATFTSSTDGSWSDALRSTPAFRQLFSALARGLSRSRAAQPPEIWIGHDPLRSDVRLVTIASPLVTATPEPIVRIFRDRGAGEPLALTTVGPGTFQAEVPIGSTFLVDARMPFDPEPTAAAGDELPYPAALRGFGPAPASLARLASLGGGRVVERPEQVFEQVEEVTVRRSLRTPMLLTALVLYLWSLLLLRMPDRRLEAASVAVAPRAPKKTTAAIARKAA